jgi:hypothetical protein
MSVTPGQMQSVLETSGSYQFAPSMGEGVLYAYGQCGIRRAQLTQQHFEDARLATNFMMSRWSAKGVNLWQVDSQTINLVQGVSTYQVLSNTIVLLDCYITLNNGAAAIDRLILPVSRTEYASYPNKQQQGFPTTYWFDRLLSPTLTLWPVPNGQQSTFTYYRLRQTQDSVLANGTNVEIPIYFLEAYVLGLAWRLACIWAADRAPVLKTLADEAYNDAINQNVETAQFYISPQIGGYFR